MPVTFISQPAPFVNSREWSFNDSNSSVNPENATTRLPISDAGSQRLLTCGSIWKYKLKPLIRSKLLKCRQHVIVLLCAQIASKLRWNSVKSVMSDPKFRDLFCIFATFSEAGMPSTDHRLNGHSETSVVLHWRPLTSGERTVSITCTKFK